MKLIVIYLIISLTFYSCTSSVAIDSEEILDNNVNKEIADKDNLNIKNGFVKFLDAKNYFDTTEDIMEFNKENLYNRFHKNAEWFREIKYWEKYECDSWLNKSNIDNVRLITSPYSLKNFNFVKKTGRNDYVFEHKKTKAKVNVEVYIYSKPKNAAFYTFQLPLMNIDNCGINTKYAVGNANFYLEKDSIMRLMAFFRDNVYIKVSAIHNDYDPVVDRFTVYDVAKELNDFIQKQPIVEEYKPATLEFTFKNYNAESFKWEPAKDYLQAAFIDDENGKEIYNDMFEQVLKKYNLLDNNGFVLENRYEKYKTKLDGIQLSLNYPLRTKIKITDQLGNEGGKVEIAAIFKGQPDAQIPEPLTIENLEKIYDIESEKGIEKNKMSWFEDKWSDFGDLDGEMKLTKNFKLTEGRYIIVIDVTTVTNVKSRHFYELKVENKKSD